MVGPRAAAMILLCGIGSVGAYAAMGWKGSVISYACYLIGAGTVWATQADLRSLRGEP